MSTPFVPFTIPSASVAPEQTFSAKLMPSAQASHPSAPPPAPAIDGDARVELVKEGECVKTIRLHCSCGTVHELRCAY